MVLQQQCVGSPEFRPQELELSIDHIKYLVFIRNPRVDGDFFYCVFVFADFSAVRLITRTLFAEVVFFLIVIDSLFIYWRDFDPGQRIPIPCLVI